MIDILREIGMIDRALDSIANIEFKQVDLARGQYLYVVRIYEHPGIISEQLSNLIKVDRTTIARAVKKLEKNGFIERKNDPENKKIKRLYVTEKGKSIYPFIIRENRYSNNEALKGFSAEEAQQVHDYLVRIRQNIDGDWETVKRGGKRQY
ncbi:MarR family transcriptional regulator [Limosilactobacillus sp. STM2_1]|uniref:MarR family transcriptional regulator n=1 Tax=Limosilactobacillus rudii TaxID=2759755 RepID=A0A7W3YNL2_9LACO|nr:MarR family transcriptional regulator [Limosilactobacillus rudii]MBB1079381.1 MarR family transcriptional regulator [Limosilactobacillus rudii]MBB1097427.1 MarR family transcriptional regulator [Limosilactobacillus rudii]MCD7134536.1 MarR family transcriptional regulator [Limosilactobacillus rudii]